MKRIVVSCMVLNFSWSFSFCRGIFIRMVVALKQREVLETGSQRNHSACSVSRFRFGLEAVLYEKTIRHDRYLGSFSVELKKHVETFSLLNNSLAPGFL